MPKTYGPILIEVLEDRYEMYGAPTLKNRFLAGFLKGLGGINHTVEPGTYEFSILREGAKISTQLYPAK